MNKHCSVKICDLELAKCHYMNDELKTRVNTSFNRGTTTYMSPELIRKEAKPNRCSDVWAVACTLYELYEVHKVWQANDGVDGMLAHFVREKVPEFKLVARFLREALRGCFDYDASKRKKIDALLLTYQGVKSKYPTLFFE